MYARDPVKKWGMVIGIEFETYSNCILKPLQGVLWLDKDHEDMEVLGASYLAQVINQQNKLEPGQGWKTYPPPSQFTSVSTF